MYLKSRTPSYKFQFTNRFNNRKTGNGAKISIPRFCLFIITVCLFRLFSRKILFVCCRSFRVMNNVAGQADRKSSVYRPVKFLNEPIDFRGLSVDGAPGGLFLIPQGV